MRLFHLLLLISIVFFQSCNTDNQENPNQQKSNNTYVKTIFPADTTMLWVESGNISNDTVLVVTEGGPKSYLDFEASGRVYWEYLKHSRAYHFAVVHQSSTYNKSILGATNFSINDAKNEVDNTSEILHRTIEYYKKRNKHVVVFGHSYGAFTIANYLSTRPSLADKYFITGGRLDADSLQTSFQSKGINSEFEEDGITFIIPDEDETPNRFRTDRYYTIRKNKEYLKYAIGKPKYTKELAGVDLSNVVFYYGLFDGNVGKLTNKEIKFLESKNAQVVGVETGHYDIWKKVVDGFTDGDLSF